MDWARAMVVSSASERFGVVEKSNPTRCRKRDAKMDGNVMTLQLRAAKSRSSRMKKAQWGKQR